jgi:hypothetical protein
MAAKAPRNSPNSPKQRISPLLDTILTGPTDFNEVDKGKRYIGREISLKALRAIPKIEKCWLGRIGIIPYYKTPNNIHLLLVRNNWEDKKTGTKGKVTGFIGGGVGKNKTAMQGLHDELTEEVPEYYDAIMTQLQEDNVHNMTIILIAELAADVNSEKCKLVSTYSIIIFLNVTNVDVLKQMPHTFAANTNMSKSHKYREIEQVLDVSMFPMEGSVNSFLQVLQTPVGKINIGLEYYKKYLEYSGVNIHKGRLFMECLPRQIVQSLPRVLPHARHPVSRRSMLPHGYRTHTRCHMSPKTAYRKVMGTSPNKTVKKSPNKSPTKSKKP